MSPANSSHSSPLHPGTPPPTLLSSPLGVALREVASWAWACLTVPSSPCHLQLTTCLRSKACSASRHNSREAKPTLLCRASSTSKLHSKPLLPSRSQPSQPGRCNKLREACLRVSWERTRSFPSLEPPVRRRPVARRSRSPCSLTLVRLPPPNRPAPTASCSTTTSTRRRPPTRSGTAGCCSQTSQ